MATITIRNLPEETKRRLRMRAAENGRSMEAEARETLVRGATAKNSATKHAQKHWVDEIITEMRAIGNTEFVLPEREFAEDPVDFSGPEFEP